MTTLPESTAFGAIQAVGWIWGRCPRCSTSTDAAPAVHGAECFRLGPSRQPGGSTIDRASAPPPTLGRRSSVAYRSLACSRSTGPCETPPPGAERSGSALDRCIPIRAHYLALAGAFEALFHRSERSAPGHLP